MKKFSIFTILAVFLALAFTCILPGEVLADGDETLGPPVGISIESGSDILLAGTGLSTQQPGTIDITIPGGVTIKQVLLYWQGIQNKDNTIIVEGTEITGELIGTGNTNRFCYRADITTNGFVAPGPNSLSVSGLNFAVNDGAGVLVIIDDWFNAAEIALRDGDDYAYWPLPSPSDTTVPQTFFFTAESVDRKATLSMFFSSVSGTVSGGDFRPSAIVVKAGGTTTVFNDLLDSVDGEEWDTLRLSVDIPAYANSLTVQALSVDNPGGKTGDPASFDWLVGALSVPISGGEGCTPGYWKQSQHFDSWAPPYTPETLFSDIFENAFPGKTLLEVLQLGDGGLEALGRHTVAALLNAASSGVSYDLTVDEVIEDFNDVFPGGDYENLKDYFEYFNTQGCPPLPIEIKFTDIPPGYWAEQAIYKIYKAGITKGCSQNPLMYCPEEIVTRAQMAVFLGRGIHGSTFDPPDATGIFDDVPVSYWAADWIEQFYNDGITSGCSTNPLRYCPESSVTRAQMAIFLLRAKYGSNYTPPPATGIFNDVPVGRWAADWIEQLYREGITKGCPYPNFCPNISVTRAQMAKFLVRTFGL